MSADAAPYAEDIAVLDAETARLIRTVEAMVNADIVAASSLPGWSRGHVLAHLDGNARGLGRLARSAIDGVARQMYQSPESREADISWRATRDVHAHLGAVQASAGDLRRDLVGITPQRFSADVRLRNGSRFDAREIVLLRIQEVSMHHSDLGLPSYTWRDWPARLIEWRFDLLLSEFRERGDVPVAWLDIDGVRVRFGSGVDGGLAGSSQAVMAWLTGRSGGEGLQAVGAMADIPPAPPWL